MNDATDADAQRLEKVNRECVYARSQYRARWDLLSRIWRDRGASLDHQAWSEVRRQIMDGWHRRFVRAIERARQLGCRYDAAANRLVRRNGDPLDE